MHVVLLGVHSWIPEVGRRACVAALTWMQPGLEVLSMREAVFMVSPKMLNLGSLRPISPETTGPVWKEGRTNNSGPAPSRVP